MGCIVLSVYLDSSSGHEHYTFVLVSSATLAANTDYRLMLSTFSETFTADGVIMPTSSGQYRLDLLVDPTGSGTFSIHNHIYM
jgi:hypothetical protein